MKLETPEEKKTKKRQLFACWSIRLVLDGGEKDGGDKIRFVSR